jgi:hypothetical protein
LRYSTHYYVLSLSTSTSSLFEAFRDSLIDVENQGFPVAGPARKPHAAEQAQQRELARTIDRCFGHYYTLDPLGLVVVGIPEMQSAFSSVTVHGTAIIGRIDGDHMATSARDLGQIVWPVVKEAMSGVLDRAMRDLDEFSGQGQVASGLEAVARAAGREGRATLLVEADYHLRGSIQDTSGPPVMTPNVDIRETIDDVVDILIERVLESAGNVVFVPPGSLSAQEQIVLLPSGANGP